MEEVLNEVDIPVGVEFEVDYKFYEDVAFVQLFMIKGFEVVPKTIAEMPVGDFEEWVVSLSRKKIKNAVEFMLA